MKDMICQVKRGFSEEAQHLPCKLQKKNISGSNTTIKYFLLKYFLWSKYWEASSKLALGLNQEMSQAGTWKKINEKFEFYCSLICNILKLILDFLIAPYELILM